MWGYRRESRELNERHCSSGAARDIVLLERHLAVKAHVLSAALHQKTVTSTKNDENESTLRPHWP